MHILKIATVFSGIGAFEESLKQLGIPHVIKFACDNGEREPKLELSNIYKAARSAMSEEDVKILINNLINIIFTRKFKNPRISEEVTILYNSFRSLSVKEAINQIEDLKPIEFDGEKADFILKFSDLQDAIKFLNEEDLNKFVDSWYKTTRNKNFVKKSYLANYEIENNSWYEDIRFLDGRKYCGEVDLFCGGSPCQSFSTYGKKRGLEDARGTLFYDYARLISEIKPKVFIYENVKGLLTHDKKRTWEIIKEIFNSLNYKIYDAVLDAQNYGLPQMRERVFVIGLREDIVLKGEFKFPDHIKLNKFSEDYLDDNVDNKYYLGQKGFEWATSTQKNKNKTRVNRSIIGCQTANQQDNWIGDLRIEYPQQRHRNDPRIYIGQFDGHEAVARKMTPRECLKLMGFKLENFKIVVDDIRMYRQAGNSIAVPVLNAIMKQLQPLLDFEITKDPDEIVQKPIKK